MCLLPLCFIAEGPTSVYVHPSGAYLLSSSPGNLRPTRRVSQALGPQRRLRDGLTYQGYEKYSTEL